MTNSVSTSPPAGVPQRLAAGTFREVCGLLTSKDVEELALDSFDYRLLSDNEVIDGHKTYKIEAKRIDAGLVTIEVCL